MVTSPKTVIKTIRVTKTGIKQGDKGEAQSCPIARAVKAAGFEYASVDCEGIGAATRTGKGYHVPFYKWIKNFITKFDNGKKVNPFTRKVRFILTNG